jgi:hypothetical protein
MHMKPWRSATFYAAIAVCIASGAFVGFSLCGGSVHHRHIARAVALVAGLVAVAFPIPSLASIRRRIVVAASVALLSLGTETVAAACYPGLPASWGDFIHNISYYLETGSC